MALLFEKCEQASQTPDCPSSDSFDVDIQAFVHHQEQDGKPFFSEDPELDSLVRIALKWVNGMSVNAYCVQSTAVNSSPS